MTRTADALPSPGGSVLARPRLDGRLDDVLERRLTTLVADAGFGKSTLIAGWADRVPTAWYTLDRDDAALSGLARGVVEALARHCPPLSPELVAATRGQRGPQPDEDARADAVASVLCQELEATLQAPLLLVLDDLHALGSSGPAVRFVEGVVRHAPPMLHLVLASRAEPPFPIERLRSQGHVLSLDASALAFSPEETESALATALGEDARGLAPALHASSGGWPAAVRLLIEALRDDPRARRDAALASLTASAEPVLGYLAEEVFAAVAAPVRELVRVSSCSR